MDNLKKITVLGGGNTGHGAAGYFALKGFPVTMCDTEDYAARFDDIKEKGGILLRGTVRGIGKVEKLTHDFAEAVKDADLIFVDVVAWRHEEIAKAIAPHLHEGQEILIAPGNLGSFVFKKVFDAQGVQGVGITELEGNLFPIRITGKAEVCIGMPIGPHGAASLPSSHTAVAVEAFKGVFDLVAKKNVFECAINSTNFVNHLGTTILAGALINKLGSSFNLYRDALIPEAFNLSEKIEAERQAVIAAMGFALPKLSPADFLKMVADTEHTPQFDLFRTMDGPDSLQHRYITEDVPCCGSFCSSVGKLLGVKTPVLDAVLTFSAAALNVDYSTSARTLENLGFGGLSWEEINKMV